uniref:MPN domain-containing protein n=1 Tax=Tetradesmus obliquus TaxID=3088 RepID=A0A383WMB0_TETOB|eukprot:jgi/Sobl393_1/13108/SZX78362.1
MRGSRRRDDDYALDEDMSDSDEEPAPKPSRARKQAAAKPRRAPKRPAGLVNLKGLIDEGLMQPGDDVLTVEYKGTLTHASLTHDGRIRWKELFFDSPSAFSIYLKRLVNPARKADDGWKTVKYLGKFLEQYKMDLLLRRYGEDGAGSAGSGMDSGVPPPLPPSKRARTASGNGGAAAAAAAAQARPAAAPGAQSSAPALRQLAPRGGRSSRGGTPAAAASGTTAAAAGAAADAAANSSRAPPRPPLPASSAGAVAAAAAAATAAAFAGGASPAAAPSSSGAANAAPSSSAAAAAVGGRVNANNEHTPRRADLGCMAPAEHEFAPRPGELAGLGAGADGVDDVLPVELGPKHFLSGVELEAITNGTCTPSSTYEAAYTPPGLAVAAALAEAATAADGTATPSTAAATGRPRRMIRPPERLINNAAMLMGGLDKDDHDMVRCEVYGGGPPGSGLAGAQPFRVQVAPLAEVVMDFHAHLDRHEVIGLLAGSWQPQQRLLRVERAFPVREAAGGGAGTNDGTNVEMDPEDQLKVTEVISELWGLSVVGWYHSHPSFPALPSVIDIANQLQMQQQVRSEGSSDEPYIAAIMSPYNRRLPGLQSSVTWFRVEGGGGKAGANVLEQGYVPVELAIERLLRPATPAALMATIPALRTTALRYANKRSAANLAGQWLPPAAVAGAAAAAAADASVGGSGGEAAVLGTRLGKLLGSMRAWWPHSCGADSCRRWMEALKAMLVEAGLAGAMAAAERQQQQQQRSDADRSSSAGPEQQQQQQQQRFVSKPLAATSLARALLAGATGGGVAAAAAAGPGRAPGRTIKIRSKTPPAAVAAAAAGLAGIAAIPQLQQQEQQQVEQQQVQQQQQQQQQQQEEPPQQADQPQQQDQLQQEQQQAEVAQQDTQMQRPQQQTEPEQLEPQQQQQQQQEPPPDQAAPEALPPLQQQQQWQQGTGQVAQQALAAGAQVPDTQTTDAAAAAEGVVAAEAAVANDAATAAADAAAPEAAVGNDAAAAEAAPVSSAAVADASPADMQAVAATAAAYEAGEATTAEVEAVAATAAAVEAADMAAAAVEAAADSAAEAVQEATEQQHGSSDEQAAPEDGTTTGNEQQ